MLIRVYWGKEIMMNQWTFFSNHGHVILLLGQSPDLTYREIATRVGITERFAQKIVSDLVDDSYLTITKDGRRNSYQINHKKFLRHEIEQNCRVIDLLDAVKGNSK